MAVMLVIVLGSAVGHASIVAAECGVGYQVLGVGSEVRGLDTQNDRRSENLRPDTSNRTPTFDLPATLRRRPWQCRKITTQSHGLECLSSISARANCARA